MESMGSHDINIRDDLWSTDRREFYQMVARVIEIIEEIHDLGILHGDLHIDNIKIGNVNDVESTLSLIDFGLSRPYVDETGHHLTEPADLSRREDMKRFASEFSDLAGRQTDIVIGFREEMNCLAREERPNYRKWIQTFRSAAEMMADADDLYDDA
jgi:tRNA A-37 threonylcarbamoyl transferase component Bud32